jgi:hypothetical protein
MISDEERIINLGTQTCKNTLIVLLCSVTLILIEHCFAENLLALLEGGSVSFSTKV